MITSVGVSKTDPTLDELFYIEIIETGSPSILVAEIDYGEGWGGRFRKVFPAIPDPAGTPDKYVAKVYGWQMGAFPGARDVVITAFSDTPSSLSNTISMEVVQVRDVIRPVLDYFVQFLQNHPEMGQKEFAKAYKLIRKPRQVKTESPAFFVRMADLELVPLLASTEMKWVMTVTINYLESIRNKREIDPIKHQIFVRDVVNHVSSTPSPVSYTHLRAHET